jgi:hypothetical protein
MNQLNHLTSDPDIRSEAAALSALSLKPPTRTAAQPRLHTASVPLNVVRQAHAPSPHTMALVSELGGLPVLRRFANAFYERAFLDPHLDQFIRE